MDAYGSYRNTFLWYRNLKNHEANNWNNEPKLAKLTPWIGSAQYIDNTNTYCDLLTLRVAIAMISVQG